MTITDQDFHRLRDYMYQNFGINLEKKRTLVEGRLGSSVHAAGFNNFHDFVNDVLSDSSGKKINELITKLTTNYTYFMREEAHYRFMTEIALPTLVNRIKDKDLRIWSAGCSSGEEAYTTAMVVNEFFGMSKSGWDTTILATDISPRVLSAAKAAKYPLSSLDRLPENWKRKYFTKAGPEEVKISDNIAKEVVFAQFNLMGDFNRFRRKFHIIFCRNVMIYFDNPTKAELTKKYYNALEPGGYLFIGLSETLSGINGDFEQLAPAIYRKGK